MSVMITVEFKIKPEKVDEALEEMREGLPSTRNFQGCQRIDSYFGSIFVPLLEQFLDPKCTPKWPKNWSKFW